jgi:hypothetical protein
MPAMVAKAAWLTVEPTINLASYLISEETQFFPAKLKWLTQKSPKGEDRADVLCLEDEAEAE